MDEIQVGRDGKIRLTLESGGTVRMAPDAITSFASVRPKSGLLLTELRLESGVAIHVKESIPDIMAALEEAERGDS
jgi:hypothetical protein